MLLGVSDYCFNTGVGCLELASHLAVLDLLGVAFSEIVGLRLGFEILEDDLVSHDI